MEKLSTLHHNLRVAAKRLEFNATLTEESVAKADALATKNGLFSDSRGTAFALVALNVISREKGNDLSPNELNVIVRTLAHVHDKCVLGQDSPVETTQTSIRNLCVANKIFGLGQLPLIGYTTNVVEIVRKYKEVRDAEKVSTFSAGKRMANAVLGAVRPKAGHHIPGIDDNETDLIKLGYM